MCTIKCAGLFESKSSTPEEVAQRIQELMRPLLLEGSDRSANVVNNGIQKLLLDLCRDAYNFGLLVRHSKAAYCCEYPKVESALVEDDAEPHACEGPKDGKADEKVTKVARLHFGAFVKYLEDDRAERIVLEKAHVVIRQS
jgi:hypothetical protein